MDRSEAARLAKELTDGVMCDGFHGYLFNEHEDPNDALEALEMIGAAKTASIVRRVFARFPGGRPPANQTDRQVALELVAPRGDEFEADDEDFFAYPEDVFKLADECTTAET
jgi:hypothetical protein